MGDSGGFPWSFVLVLFVGAVVADYLGHTTAADALFWLGMGFIVVGLSILVFLILFLLSIAIAVVIAELLGV